MVDLWDILMAVDTIMAIPSPTNSNRRFKEGPRHHLLEGLVVISRIALLVMQLGMDEYQRALQLISVSTNIVQIRG